MCLYDVPATSMLPKSIFLFGLLGSACSSVPCQECWMDVQEDGGEVVLDLSPDDREAYEVFLCNRAMEADPFWLVPCTN
eukprot:291254-Amphidinium_carterae.2